MNSPGPTMRSDWAGGHGGDRGHHHGSHGPLHPRSHRALVVIEIIIVALVGGWLGLLAGGNLDAPVGPLRVHLSVAPSLEGGSVASIPPLGQLRLATHSGPWQLRAEVTRIDAADARRIFADPTAVTGLGDEVSRDLRSAARTVIIKSGLATVAGALLLGVLVFRRRWRRIAASALVSAALVLAGGGIAAATFDKNAVNQPEYDGLLASAPGVVGDARSIVANFGKYEDQLARLVTNVSRLYDVTSTLPAYQPDPSTVRVLFVSDLHLNPAAWDVIRSITKQFKVTMIIDAGDISDHGTAAENTYVDQIATLGVPYVWVRGNRDSAVTQAEVAAQPNAVVLDSTTPVEVGGLRLIGLGDPRFTPDKDTRGAAALETVADVGRTLAAAARAQPLDEPVDVAVIHDGSAAVELDGAVPLVLSGHYHRREQTLLPGGTLSFFQGSTGASGLRGLEGPRAEKPTPVRASVLYVDRATRKLQAWDDITLGGLGLQSAKIERRIVAQQFAELSPSPSPSPTDSASLSPSGTASSSTSPGATP